ncbi:MAG: tetratricopeptide repeat protein [Anaerolineae bacterium]|nr:tetratricopeptide repeat protein [Anaerolineae bacterium]
MLRIIAVFVIVFILSVTNSAFALQAECPPCQADDCTTQYLQLAQGFFSVDEYESAISVLECAIDSSPQDPIPFLGRAFAYVQLREYDLGEADARHAIELDPKIEWSSEVIIAQIRFEMEDLPGAISSMLRAVELEPDRPELLYTLSYYYLEDEKYETGIDWISRAIELTTDSSGYYLLRAYAYDKLGREQEAASDIEIALEAEPDIVTRVVGEADAHSHKNRFRSAYRGLELVLLVLKYKPEQIHLLAP